MSRFKKKRGKETPGITTASLPDIIFMLLFFFMVVTSMRDSTNLVKLSLPSASEVKKIENKDLVSYISIGSPIDNMKEVYGTAPRIQLNDAIANKEQIALFIEQERVAKGEAKRDKMILSIKADKEVTMGIITDVKQELRKVNQLRINYQAGQRTGELK